MDKTFKIAITLLLLLYMSNVQAQFEKKLEVKAYLVGGTNIGTNKYKSITELYGSSTLFGYGGALNFNLNRRWVSGVKYFWNRVSYNGDFQNGNNYYNGISFAANEIGLNLQYNIMHSKKFKIYTQGSLLGFIQTPPEDFGSYDLFSYYNDMKPFVFGAEVSLGLKRNLIKDLGFFFDMAYAYQEYYHGPRFRLGLFFDFINE